MDLFTLPNIPSTRANDSNIIKKTAKKVSKQVIKSGSSLLERITNITTLVNQKLGSYKEKYECIRTENDLEDYISACIKFGKCSIDTETTGLNPMLDDIVGFSIYTPGKKAAYIPLTHIDYISNEIISNQLSKDFTRRQLQRLADADVKIIMFNAKFDIRVLRHQLGVYLTCWWDGYIAQKLLNENETENGLKYLHNKYVLCGEKDAFSFSDLFDDICFNLIPIKTGFIYAARDAEITYELYEYQEQFLDKTNQKCIDKDLVEVANVFRDIEMPLIQVVFEMECTGVEIDTALAEELRQKYTKYMVRAENKFNEECAKLDKQFDELLVKNPGAYSKLFKDPGSRNISISSPTQLAILFYDVLKFKSPDPKKPRGTGEDILKSFDHPLVDSILEYRSMSKLLTTYIDAIPQHISKRDNRLHANFNQYGAKTGRFSSSDPNLQNIPSNKTKLSDGTVIDAGHDIRQMFIAGEGQVIVGGDFSQQEPRCLAHMSDDEHMINAYIEGKDLYGTIASKIYKMPYEECLEFRPDGTVNPEGKQRRSSVKPVLLGLMYGRSGMSIAEQMGVSQKEGQGIIDDFFKSFPKVKEFIDFAQSFAMDYGFVETAWGRKRRLPDMQLPPIEIKPCIKSYSDNFDPFAFNANDLIPQDDYVPDEIYRKYYTLLNKARGKQQQQKVKELAEQEGYSIKDNRGFIEDAKRQCVNSIIQGSAADMTKITMIKIFNDKELNELGYKLIISVHDEVLGICPKENAKAVRDRLEHIMVHIVDGKFKIPMKCDIEVTERWYGEGIEL